STARHRRLPVLAGDRGDRADQRAVSRGRRRSWSSRTAPDRRKRQRVDDRQHGEGRRLERWRRPRLRPRRGMAGPRAEAAGARAGGTDRRAARSDADGRAPGIAEARMSGTSYVTFVLVVPILVVGALVLYALRIFREYE